MPRFQKLNDQLALIHAAPDEVQTLDRALAFAVTALSCDMAGVMLMTDGRSSRWRSRIRSSRLLTSCR